MTRSRKLLCRFLLLFILLSDGQVFGRSFPLHDAVDEGDMGKVSRLLAQGADIDEVWRDEHYVLGTPLHHAVAREDEPMVEFLLAKGAKTDSRDQHGQTPLHWASNEGGCREGILARLIGNGAPIDSTDDYGETPLFKAVKGFSDEKASGTPHFLLLKGANPNIANRDGVTPLHVAAEAGNGPIVRLLLTHGADPDPVDSCGMTPLCHAMKSRFREVCDLLIGKGADPGIWTGGNPSRKERAALETLKSFDGIWGLQENPSGSMIGTCDCAGNCYLWNSKTLELADFFVAPGNYTHPAGWVPGEVRFFGGGKFLFSFIAPSDGDPFHIWNTETGEMAFSGDDGIASFMAPFLPDPVFEEWMRNPPRIRPELFPTPEETLLLSKTGGSLLTSIPMENGCFLSLVEFEKPQQAVFRFNPKKGSVDELLRTERIPWIRSLALSEKKDRLATGGLYGSIAIWDVRTGKRLVSWVGHRGHVRAVSFTDDDRTLITGCDTGHDQPVFPPELKKWESSTGRPISRFRTTLGGE